VQEAENLKLILKQDPSSYDSWFAMGEMSLEVALAATGEQASCYLMEVCLATPLHSICSFPMLSQALQAYENALKIEPMRPEAMAQSAPKFDTTSLLILTPVVSGTAPFLI
jgi:hypothetical protein